jgi:hypothetical protein
MNYSTPKVTIDLEEYQELQRYKTFKENSHLVLLKPIPFEANIVSDYDTFEVSTSSSGVNRVMGFLKFENSKTKRNILENYDLKFILKEKK